MRENEEVGGKKKGRRCPSVENEAQIFAYKKSGGEGRGSSLFIKHRRVIFVFLLLVKSGMMKFTKQVRVLKRKGRKEREDAFEMLSWLVWRRSHIFLISLQNTEGLSCP